MAKPKAAPELPHGFDLWREARCAVLAQVESDDAGAKKMAAALAEATRRIDKAIKWPPTPAGVLGETLDGPLIKLMLRATLQAAYNAIKAEGRGHHRRRGRRADPTPQRARVLTAASSAS